MWLLILAIVILILSAFQMSYYVVGSRQGANRPHIFYKHEGFLICSNTVFLIAGFTMLFIATGWRWGLGGLAIYWVLVGFVLNPIINRLIGGEAIGGYGQHICSLTLDEFGISADEMRALIVPTLPLQQALISLGLETPLEPSPGEFIMVVKKGILFSRKWVALYYSSKNPDDALELKLAEGDYHPIACLLKKHDTEAARETIKGEILRQLRKRREWCNAL